MAQPEEEFPAAGNLSPEKLEELKLKQKFPQLKSGGTSHFLQKRVQHRQKYFDSGDYNMARAQGAKVPSVLPQKPPLKVVVDETSDGNVSPTGCEIPTPDTVPMRKTSIIQPEVGCKLSPQPVHHHAVGSGPLAELTDAQTSQS